MPSTRAGETPATRKTSRATAPGAEAPNPKFQIPNKTPTTKVPESHFDPRFRAGIADRSA